MQGSEPSLNVKASGAKGDCKAIDTAAIQAAIDECESSGGGTVIVPPGKYRCGTIHLRDNLHLCITAGATLVAVKDDALFDPPDEQKFPDAQGRMECGNFHHALLAGDEIDNVCIDGGGSLDDERLRRHGPKPLALKNSSRITIRDITSHNSANYAVSLGNCEVITIENVRVFTSNADGIDLESCRNARVAGCHVESRDDAVVLKGSLAHGKPVMSSNIVVTGCDLATSCVGFKIGSETNGDFRNIVLSNCTIHSLGIARPPLAGIAIESVDGATIKGMTVSNITMAGMKSPLLVRLGRRLRGMMPATPGEITDVSISNIVATGSRFPLVLGGLPGKPITRISLANLHLEFDYAGIPVLPDPLEPGAEMEKGRPPGTTDFTRIPENEERYPDIRMFGDPLPAWGLFARHVSGLRMTAVDFVLQGTDPRPSHMCIDAEPLDMDGVRFTRA